MPRRIVPLVKNEVYHIFSRSIAEFVIFNNNEEYRRMMETIKFYNTTKPPCKFSIYKELAAPNNEPGGKEKLVDILAYCLMPTHFHMVLKETDYGNITKFIHSVLNSYSQYFNTRHLRHGPLWQSRFKNVLVKDDIQLLHVTRYLHLNPVTAFIINSPDGWKYSSYMEYMGLLEDSDKICNFSQYIAIEKKSYEKFVKDRIGYQRDLAMIKAHCL
ncbi:MAG: transposase [Candidatus Omnitrophota bacterium]|nr:transposase [Candidatus Omnitrophota bacterium]